MVSTATDVCSGLVLLNKGSNGCKSRPVFSLSPFSSQFAPSQTRNRGDFAQIVPFYIPFLTSNQTRTTWCVQAPGVCSGLVLLNKGSNGCKSRPVFSLFPFSSRFYPGHCLHAGDFALNRPFHHIRHFANPQSAPNHVAVAGTRRM